VYQYSFHNKSVNDDNTLALATLPTSKSAPTSTTMWNYGTDLVTGVAGRYVSAPAGSNTSTTYVTNFVYGMPATSKLKGTATVQLYARPASFLPTDAPTFSVTLTRLTSAGVATSDTSTSTFTSAWGCNTFRPFTVGFNIGGGGWTVAANEQVRVQVKVTNSVPVVIAYDTSTFPSGMQLPITSGVG